MHLLSTSSTSLDDIVEPVDLGQTPGDIAILSFADSDLAGLSAAWAARTRQERAAAERAAGAVARPEASDVGRSLDRAGRFACEGDRRAAVGRSRLVALRRRPAVGAGEGARHRAGHAAGRGPRRPTAGRMLDPAAGRTCRAARIFPRGRARQSPRPAAQACRAMPARPLDCNEPQPLPRFGAYAPSGQAIGLDRLLCGAAAGQAGHPASCSIARCCWPRTLRRSTRFARR